MAILMMIDKFPDFLQHLVLDYDVPFTDIINLSQTCQDLHQWVMKSFKAYYILHLHNVIKNNTIFSESNFYTNITERRLFQIIYKLHKNKMSFNEAILNSIIPILDWWLIEKLKLNTVLDYPENAIYIASQFKNFNVLNWWLNAAVKYPNLVILKYYDSVINYVSQCGYTDVLNWWLKASIFYPKIIILKYSNLAMDSASATGEINSLNWWLNSAIFYPYFVQLKYTESAIDKASQNGQIEVLNWWLNASKKYPNLITFKYSENAIDNTIKIDVLEWWLNSGLPLKYSRNALRNAIFNCNKELVQWWFNSGLILKLSRYTNNGYSWSFDLHDTLKDMHNWLTTTDLSRTF